MNILLINHYAGSPKLGMEYRPLYMAKSVRELGHNMFVLAADQSHLRSQQPRCGHESLEGIDHLWLKTKPYAGNGFGRVLNIFSFLMQVFKHASDILDWSRPDVIVASSTYPLDNYLAHYLAKKCDAKVIYEVHDLWPLSPMEIGNISKWHPFMLLLQAAENYGYRKADKVISMLPNTLEHMLSHGLVEEKFHYIPNGILCGQDESGEASLPLEHDTYLRQLESKSKVIIGYAGGHAKSNALHKLIEAAKQLPELEFVLVGSGSEKNKLQALAESLSNVHFLPSIEKKQVAAFLARCDFLTLVWNDSPLYRFGVSPNKVFDYMLAKKPIVQLLTTCHEPVTKANAGFTVSTMSSYISKLREVALLSDEQRETIGERGYQYVLDNHCYGQLAQEFIKVCEK